MRVSSPQKGKTGVIHPNFEENAGPMAGAREWSTSACRKIDLQNQRIFSALQGFSNHLVRKLQKPFDRICYHP